MWVPNIVVLGVDGESPTKPWDSLRFHTVTNPVSNMGWQNPFIEVIWDGPIPNEDFPRNINIYIYIFFSLPCLLDRLLSFKLPLYQKLNSFGCFTFGPWPRSKIYINLRVILSGEERVPFRLVHKSRQKNHEKSWGWYQFSVIKLIPKHSLCGIFTSIYRKNEPNVGRYTAYNECLGSHLRYQSATKFLKL